jgi:aryl-alcohol dehydrogenase-like predicted oxidoreductase
MPSRPDAHRLLHRALDLGINLVDTARAYGVAEELIGEAIAGRRREYHLISKAPAEPAAISASIETSLRALRTGTIDILMLHSASLETIEQGDALAELVRARQQGKIRFTGASVYGEDAALAAIRCGGFDCLQVAYSALDRRPEGAVFAAATHHDIGIQARSVLLKGALTHRRHQLPAALSGIVEVANRIGEPLPEIAYRYAISCRPPHTVLVGTASAEELEQAVRWIEQGPLAAGEVDRIRRLPLPDPHWLHPGNWPSF